MNQKDFKIIKLFEKGLKVEQIAKRLGYCGRNLEEGKKRIIKTLKNIC